MRTITTIEDFFEFLAQNPKAGTISYTYYCAPVKINKNLEGRGKNAIKNPMYNETLDHSIIFKCNWYMFNFGETYIKAMKKIDPNFVPTERNTSLTKHPHLKYVESGPDGDYFNILPKDIGKSTYAIYDINAGLNGLKDGNNYRIVTDYKEIEQFFPVRKQYDGPIDYRKFFVSRTFEIAAGGNLFSNPNFKYFYFGNKPNR